MNTVCFTARIGSYNDLGFGRPASLELAVRKVIWKRPGAMGAMLQRQICLLPGISAVGKAVSLVGLLTPVMDWVTESSCIWTSIISTNPLSSSV